MMELIDGMCSNYHLICDQCGIKIMQDKDRLLAATSISLIGDQITHVALAALLFQLSGSGKLVASIVIFKTLGIFLSGFLVPAFISKITNRKLTLVILDLIRAVLILVLVTVTTSSLIFLVVFLSSILSGAFYPIKQSAVQQLLQDDKRFKFITVEQSYQYLIVFAVPAIAGIAAGLFDIRILLLIDVITFIISAVFLIKVTPWEDKGKFEPKNNIFKRAISGYKIILSKKTQTTLLSFRLVLLFALTAYEVLSILVITNLSKNCNIPLVANQCDFSILYGALLSINAATFIVVNLLSGKYLSSKDFSILATPGILLLATGLLLWAVPISMSYSWAVYILAAVFLSAGICLCRLFLYNAGYKLTDKEIFVEVVSSADSIARFWQSLISFSVISVSVLLPVNMIVLAGGLISSTAIFPASSIIKSLRTSEKARLSEAG